MQKHHPENERVKHRYYIFLREAKRLSENTVDRVAASIAAFEKTTKCRDFKKFHVEQARRFKRVLDEQLNSVTEKPLAKTTIHARLSDLKAFFQWVSEQPGYRSRIGYSDAEYFNPSANDGRIAKTVRERPAPTLDQIRCVLNSMPKTTDVEKRNIALIALAILTGARDNAIASLSLKHVVLDKWMILQDAREVRTKRGKTITTFFFPVGEDIESLLAEWYQYLETVHQFGPDDPLFPSTQVALDANNHFKAAGLGRAHWKDASPIRRIFREAFTGAGLPYFHPHSFRKTLTLFGEQVCQTPEEFKAWSQNLGHEQVLTTFTSYGTVPPSRQGAIIGNLRNDKGLVSLEDGLVDGKAVDQLISALQRIKRDFEPL